MMRKTTLLFLLILSIALSAKAATSYVSDDLYTYVHSGPSTKYKIIASVDSGEKIKVIQTNKNTGFSKIKDSKGRAGWINSKYISNRPGLQERLAKLELQFTKLNMQLHTAKDKVKSHSSQIHELKNTNTTLNEKLQEVQTLNDNLNEKLDTEKNDLLMRWFGYGTPIH